MHLREEVCVLTLRNLPHAKNAKNVKKDLENARGLQSTRNLTQRRREAETRAL
jgi:hypothetical protein